MRARSVSGEKGKEVRQMCATNLTHRKAERHTIIPKLMLPFRYAALCSTGERWYIFYWCLDPATSKLERVRIYVNATRNKVLRKKHAERLIKEINVRLDAGYNPFVNDSNPQNYTLLSKALDFVDKYKATYLRDRSLSSMNSRMTNFREWLTKTKKDNLYAFEFTSLLARQYMNDVLMAKKKKQNVDGESIKGRTYNNCLIEMRGTFNLLVKQKYILENPFQSVDRLPETEKQKIPFSPDQQMKYRDYLLANDHEFLIISLYCYYCAIRPNEIVHLKVKDIDLERGNITVPPGVSKNKKVRKLSIPDQFIEILKARFENIDPEFYICGRGMKPGPVYSAPTRIAEHFRKIANKLNFPKEIMFYSLKDTVADRLIEAGFSARTLRDLFGHHDLSVTDNYLRGINSKGDKRLRSEFPDF
ncbi:MAG: site-specific integrase [Bacteroidota bacterium]